MKDLEIKILAFDNWAAPWTFYDYVMTDKEIASAHLQIFREIWIRVSGYEMWNLSDLSFGYNAACKFIKDKYDLSEDAGAAIARVISYD